MNGGGQINLSDNNPQISGQNQIFRKQKSPDERSGRVLKMSFWTDQQSGNNPRIFSQNQIFQKQKSHRMSYQSHSK
jgi:hypothetical protein